MSTKRPHSNDIYETWIQTEMRTVKDRVVWTIDKFAERVRSGKQGDKLDSAVFSVPEDETKTLSFQLRGFLNGDDGEVQSAEDMMALYFTLSYRRTLSV